MKTSPAGIDLIKQFEGCKLTAYTCPAGIWTIGWGSTLDVQPGMTITQEEADRRLANSLTRYETAVSNTITREMTQPQFDACVSLTYNIGPRNFSRSTVANKFNAGDAQGAADAFLLWSKANGAVLPGLIRRRKAERALFLKHE